MLELRDYLVIAAIVLAFVPFGRTAIPKAEFWKLEKRLADLQRKLDALLLHQRVPLPAVPASGLSPELERMAIDPEQKIAAIKLYREQNPGTSLAEAKQRIEDFAARR